MTALNAGLFTLVGTLIVCVIAFMLARSTQPAESKDSAVPRVYRARLVYFGFIAVALLAGLALTLPRTPYASSRNPVVPDIRVAVSGWMWTWRFDSISGDGARVGAQDLRVPVGKMIEFDVTAGDVNHGFGIYDTEGQLLAQVQAMPGYGNRLNYRFSKTGVYYILCMEFCGYAHHLMTATIYVE